MISGGRDLLTCDVPDLQRNIALPDLAKVEGHSWHYVFAPLMRVAIELEPREPL